MRMESLGDHFSSGTIIADVPVFYFALITIWAAEHFILQRRLFDAPPITAHPGFFQCARFIINLLAAALIALLLSFPWLVVLLLADFLISLVLVAYQQYFHKPMSLVNAMRTLKEGLKVTTFGARLVPYKTGAGMIACTVAMGWLAYQHTSHPGCISGNLRGFAAGFLLICLAAAIGLLQFTSFRLTSIRTASLHRCIYTYGYAISWCAEFLFSLSPKEIAREAANLQSTSPDHLAESAIPYEIDSHVVMVQVESLDWNILGYQSGGHEVTPFLNQMAKAGQNFKISAYHDNGSADMDYAVLSCGLPSKRVISYYIPGLDYPYALPRFMNGHGYQTTSIHGANGHFFNRRENFQQMGWDQMYFREELLPMQLEQSYWGARDHEIFKLSARMINEASCPQFHFLITLDSHGPFDLITEKEKLIFPGSRNWLENYLNSMSVVDKNLRDYAEALPANTLLVLYGDHASGVNYNDFSPARDGSMEYVPCLVFKCSAGLDPAKPPTTQESTEEGLSILDVVNCLKRKVASRSIEDRRNY